MKTLRFFLASIAIVAMFASCGNKEPQPQPGPGTEDKSADPGKEGESTDPGAPKSTECKLESITITAGPYTLEPFIDPVDKSIEISYMPDEYRYLDAATIEVTISDKATLTPDPSQPIDFTVDGGVTLTVTAEDGEHKTEYNVYLAAAEVVVRVEKAWEKTFGQLSLADKATADFTDCGIAFVDRNHFAYADLQVFDLDGNKVGTLNTEGITGLIVYRNGKVASNRQLLSMSNDENGILVAIANFEGELESGGTGCNSEVYAWVNGWDKAPVRIYGPVDYQCSYMSVAGDVKGDFILNFRTAATASPQMHHVLVYENGKYFKENGEPACTWYGPRIEHPSNDGCWGQQLSFFSGNPDDGFVVWDSIDAVEMGGLATDNRSAGYYVYSGFSEYFSDGANVADIPSSEETALKGQVTWTNWDADGRWYNYGNYSIGNVRAFIYNGQKYIIAASSSWPCNWITVQKADNIVLDDEETDEKDESEANYLLPTTKVENSGQCGPCSAYVFDPASSTGHIVFAAQSSVILAYDIITDRL